MRFIQPQLLLVFLLSCNFVSSSSIIISEEVEDEIQFNRTGISGVDTDDNIAFAAVADMLTYTGGEESTKSAADILRGEYRE